MKKLPYHVTQSSLWTYSNDEAEAMEAKRENVKQLRERLQMSGAEVLSKRTGEPYTVYLHAARKNHDIDNPNPVLLCLCPTCHGSYDYRHRMEEQRVQSEQLKHRLLLTIHS